MMQLGASVSHTREMNLDDIFFQRLNLLVLMAKDCLADPSMSSVMSPVKREAMSYNARHVAVDSTELGRMIENILSRSGHSGSIFIDDYFFRCAHEMAAQVQRAARHGRVDSSQAALLQRLVEDITLMRETEVFKKRMARRLV